MVSDKRRLIYDVGAHKGDDTQVYLQMGYNVVAIEANQDLIKTMEKRFADFILENRLVIIHCAISDKDNVELPFFIATDTSKSSLLDYSLIYQKQVTVIGRRLSTIIQEMGVPYYCKIDIEGADIMAINSLEKEQLPATISVETCGKPLRLLRIYPSEILETLNQLNKLGYCKFKLIDQFTFKELTDTSFYKANASLYNRMVNKVKALRFESGKGKFLCNYDLPQEAEVSGNFGDQLKGNWLSFNETKKLLFFHLEEYLSVSKNEQHIFWVDLHAML